MSPAIKVLIVDDEPLARARLVRLLEQEPDVEIAGEAGNGLEALALIQEKQPDLLLLDIQMPHMGGFDVLSELEKPPLVIFVTAFDQYAIKAFDNRAIDYLLKPYDKERFQQAIAHAREILELRFQAQLPALLNDKTQLREQPCLEIKHNGVSQKLYAHEIYYLQAQGNYVLLQTPAKKHMVRQTLTTLHDHFAHAEFLRVHRSITLNTAYIKSLVYQNNNEYLITMQDGKKFLSGRVYKDQIQEFAQNRGEL